VQDSVSLKKNLGELKLNMDAVKSIDFGQMLETPKLLQDKSWLNFDESLPFVLPVKKAKITLTPYTVHTKYNYDPVYQKVIRIDKDTWRGDPFYSLYAKLTYSNWAKKPLDKGIRKSLEEIEASGLRYNPLGGRANSQFVGTWSRTAAPTGNDFMTPFTREFWDVKGRKRRARTLEVLKAYGDSTTVTVPIEVSPIKQ
jgi:hypothetical protein